MKSVFYCLESSRQDVNIVNDKPPIAKHLSSMKQIAALLSFLILCEVPSIQAQPKSLSLKELIPLAIERSPFIKAQDLEVKARESLISHAGSFRNPEISIETENKSQPTNNTTKGMRYGFAQPLSIPGTLGAKARIAKAEANIEKNNSVSLELRTRVTVATLFYEYAADIEKAKHAEERLKRFQSVSGYLKSRTFASPRKRTESSIVSSKLLILQKALEQAKSEVDITWNQLNIYLDLPEKITPQVRWFKNPVPISEKIILEKASTNSPELLQLSIESEKNKQELALARKEFWPEVKLIGSYADLNGYDSEKIYTLGVSLPLPVFNMNRSVARAQAYRLEASQTKTEAYRRNQQRIINSAFIRHMTNQKSLAQLQVSKVAEIEKEFQDSELGFRKGLVDLVTYLEADTQHSEAIETIYNTQVEYVESMGELSMLSGDFLIPLEP